MTTPGTGAEILVVDDDRAFRISTAALLEAEGYRTSVAADGTGAVAALRERRFDLVILDLRMPGTDGLVLLEALRVWGHRVPVLIISGYGTIDSAVRSMHLGADDFLTKPVEPDVLMARVAELLARRPTSAERAAPLPGGIIGASVVMQELADRVRRVAPTETTVLVTGETGTGKELVTRAIHELSPRKGGPLTAVNCAALAEGILESELFGHVRGAFTGATRDRAGVFEATEGGTLFLDEIGEMSLALQQRLLRALQEREVTRVGATRATSVDVRVVAATNRNLREMVAAGRFREDLYYRLAVFPIDVPPLRQRKGDIPLLVDSALARLAPRVGATRPLSCSPLAMRVLRHYDWPGNVRQLFGALESAAIDASGERIEAQHLPEEVRASAERTTELRYRAEFLDDERAAIERALQASNGGLAQAADRLGMGRTTLWRKMRQYGIGGSGSGPTDRIET